MKKVLFTLVAAAMLAACGTTKSVQNGTANPKKNKNIVANNAGNGGNAALSPVEYLQKVNANAVSESSVSARAILHLNAMGREMNIDGKIQLRKDEVVRVCITPIGLFEAGRLEFTPEYVMVVNRIDKEYVKATYNDIDFLRNNNIDFYTLQSLFWNNMFVPGKKALSDADLTGFNVNMDNNTVRTITNTAGELLFQWMTEVENAQIVSASVTYGKGSSKESAMDFKYSSFVPMGIKRFPSMIEMGFVSNMFSNGKMVLGMEMGNISNDAKWESRTELSAKYKQVDVKKLFTKLMKL